MDVKRIQYHKILNNILTEYLDKGFYQEYGYTVRMQAILSNPAYSGTPGGLQAAMTKKYPDCKHVNIRIHKNLYENGTLKIARAPFAEDKFTCDYFLFPNPIEDIPSKLYLRTKEIKPFYEKINNIMYPDFSKCEKAKERWGNVEAIHAYEPFAELGDTYTNISNAVITDWRLHHASLSLYAVIKRLQDMKSNNKESDWRITKEYIYSHFKKHCGISKFNNMWKELKKSGYLLVYKTHINGKIEYCYKLHDEPTHDKPINNSDKEKIVYINSEKAQEKRKEIQDRVQEQEEAPTKPKRNKRPIRIYSPDEINSLEEQIKYNIEYDVLIKNSSYYFEKGIPYDTDTINSYVRLIVFLITANKAVKVEGVHLPPEEVKKRLMALEYRHIVYVIENIHNATMDKQAEDSKIHNIKAYKTSCLLNATITYSELDILIG